MKQGNQILVDAGSKRQSRADCRDLLKAGDAEQCRVFYERAVGSWGSEKRGRSGDPRYSFLGHHSTVDNTRYIPRYSGQELASE